MRWEGSQGMGYGLGSGVGFGFRFGSGAWRLLGIHLNRKLK